MATTCATPLQIRDTDEADPSSQQRTGAVKVRTGKREQSSIDQDTDSDWDETVWDAGGPELEVDSAYA